MKSRLTITLPDNLLTQIDDLVDKQTIRNRSHAIEHLVRQSLPPQISTAIILAGGSKHLGSNPILKKVNDEILFGLLIKHLHIYGIKHIVVCTSSDYADIKNFAGDGLLFGVKIEYSQEKTPLGTAGALKKAQSYLKNDNPILVIHGDILTDIKLDEVFDFHLQEGAQATMVVKPKLGTKQYGQVFIQGNRITTFSETGTDSGISIINTGVYVLNTEVLHSISSKKSTFLENDIFPSLAKKNQLRAYFFQGLWYDISTPQQYKEAILSWSKRS